MSRKDEDEAQLKICTLDCGARCCRYVTTTVQAPRITVDWDEIRWWLAHEGTMVTKDEDGWMLHVQTRCRHLLPNLRCGIYETRMLACEEYDAGSCEFTGEVDYDVFLRSEADLADYLERRGLKRGAEVAQQIRKTARLGQNRGVPQASPRST
jgi:Fe-S-cluster containining protein